MKLFNFIPLLALFMIVGACRDNQRGATDDDDMAARTQTDTTQISDPDDVMQEWVAAWNNNDGQGLYAMTSGDAVLFLSGTASTKDSLKAWIDDSASWMKDLQTESQMKNSGDNIAYEAGTYTHGMRENDTLELEGTYTVVWERMSNQNEWEIKLIDISPKNELDSLPRPNQ